MIAQALDKGTNIDALERLFALRERSELAESERLFNEAMTTFQTNCPAIIKDKETKSGNHYEYATLGQITMTIAKVQERCGLSHSFDSELKEDKQIVTCTVRHAAGYSRTATFTCPIDKAARMSGPQQGASALTFGRRYALLMAYGIGTADMDTDTNDMPGQRDDGPQEQPITPNELMRILREIKRLEPDAEKRQALYRQWGALAPQDHPGNWTRAGFATAGQWCDQMENGN
jgi:hypothetical protein